jgi:hypothetical protein
MSGSIQPPKQLRIQKAPDLGRSGAFFMQIMGLICFVLSHIQFHFFRVISKVVLGACLNYQNLQNNYTHFT